tara:strand:- start:6 stop:272 length:267 start_codon:yes stop_codon:yes gene_type:complete
MATDEAKAAYAQRKELPEPAFGILKERHGARRFLLRGLSNVGAEWKLLATAFNLGTLCQVSSRRLGTSSTWAGLWSSDRSVLTAVAVP